MSRWKRPGLVNLTSIVTALFVAGTLAEATQAAPPPVAVDLAVSDPLAELLVLASESVYVAPSASSQAVTATVVKNIRRVVSECRGYETAYRIDCLAEGLKQVASRMQGGDYAKAKAILNRTASKLSSLVSRNLDPNAEVIESKPNANPSFKVKRRYRAVKKEALAAVQKEAQAIVEEAVTELLRSYENSDKRYVHYQQIATATDSTKVLLRS